jgi:hypothetical protein
LPDGVEQAQRVAVDVADDEVGLGARERLKRGRAVSGLQDAVAVGGEVVGEEGARGGVLLGEQDRAGGLHEPHSLRWIGAPPCSVAGRS